MKPYLISTINAIVLISMSLWEYYNSHFVLYTNLIPITVGILLFLLAKGIKNKNKNSVLIATSLTLSILLYLIPSLIQSVGASNFSSTNRLSLIMTSGIVTLVFFIKSIIAIAKSE